LEEQGGAEVGMMRVPYLPALLKVVG